MIPFKDEEEAIHIANDTPYGLSGYVSSGDPAARQARRVAAAHGHGAPQRRAGRSQAPFGGYKQSGNGREWGHEGFERIPRGEGGDGRRLIASAREAGVAIAAGLYAGYRCREAEGRITARVCSAPAHARSQPSAASE